MNSRYNLSVGVTGVAKGRIGVAVSGGGDSVALLLSLNDAGYSIEAITIDHALRPDSAIEALGVAELCSTLDIPHTIAVWQHGDLTGNLQDAARQARQTLIAEWAQKLGLKHVALGHTLDDQAETVLMRLARGSGVDGLAGMADTHHLYGITWHRPLLGVCRDDLRKYLQARGVGWVDDPSNDNLRFDRVKMRQALALLAPLGIDATRLAQTASHMRRSRAALETATYELATSITKVTETGDVEIDVAGLYDAPHDIRYRLVAAALGWVGSAKYRPRFRALRALVDNLEPEKPVAQTLHGCSIYTLAKSKNTVVITRESSAVATPTPIPPIWDHRWYISGPTSAELKVRALGEDGLMQCPDWRESGRAFKTLLAVPSIWHNAELIAAPLANMHNGWETTLAGGTKGFYDTFNALKADQ